MTDFSEETILARQCNTILKVLKGKKNNCQPRILNPVKSFKNEGKIKILSDKEKLKEFITSKPRLQNILKEVL